MEEIKFTSRMLGSNNNLILTQYTVKALSQVEQVLEFDTITKSHVKHTLNTVDDLYAAIKRIPVLSTDHDLYAQALKTVKLCHELLAKDDLLNTSARSTIKSRLRKTHRSFMTQVWAIVGKNAYPDLSGFNMG